jgi:hypothetical protein
MSALLPGWTHEETYYLAERAYRLYREGRLREAAILFEGLAAVDLENLYCRKALAAICMRLDQHDAAVAHLDVVLGRNRFDVEALAGRCEALMTLCDFASAERDLECLAGLPAGRDDARRLRLRLPRSVSSPQLPDSAPDNLYGW